MEFSYRNLLGRCAAVVAAAGLAGNACAQLVVTEILSNPHSSNDSVWEWFEVQNTGATPINLNGAILGKLGEASVTDVDITSDDAENTEIPAGGVAVLYNGNPTAFDDAKFRQAWGLGAGVKLIAVTGWVPLPNDSNTREFGIWPDQAAYLSAQTAGFVTSYTNTLTSINYGAVNFPVSTNKSTNEPWRESLQWNGTGSHTDGLNWAHATLGGATVQSTQLTGPLDTANPGLVAAGAKPAGLYFSEVMYDPAATESDWEWVEIFNNTGNAIDFTASPGVFDDTGNVSDIRTTANILSGLIPNNSAAILYNSTPGGVTEAEFLAAWDPANTRNLNLIPVTGTQASAFPALNQAGDTIGLWTSFASYQANGGRDFGQAAVSLIYDDDPNFDWPENNDDASIHLTDFANPGAGASWKLSTVGDAVGSFTGTNEVHPGLDVGSPGSFGTSTTPTNNSDFDNDTDVDGDDFLIWQRGVGLTNVPLNDKSTGDANGDGSVNFTDYQIWRSHYGLPPSPIGAVPEPGSVALAAVALAGLACGRPRR